MERPAGRGRRCADLGHGGRRWRARLHVVPWICRKKTHTHFRPQRAVWAPPITAHNNAPHKCACCSCQTDACMTFLILDMALPPSFTAQTNQLAARCRIVLGKSNTCRLKKAPCFVYSMSTVKVLCHSHVVGILIPELARCGSRVCALVRLRTCRTRTHYKNKHGALVKLMRVMRVLPTDTCPNPLHAISV